MAIYFSQGPQIELTASLEKFFVLSNSEREQLGIKPNKQQRTMKSRPLNKN